ncbi:hypothetical protein FHR23_000911 [Stakelama sediminis]|uniref:Uncharacterized protein n=1 Tax=Stakelama sediminis TaxID=463200 RepID=A0A840YWT8_9SPHN|nr:hypothetical protein [Stakelama sediminis]
MGLLTHCRGTSPLPHPATHERILIGWPGDGYAPQSITLRGPRGGAGWCRLPGGFE